MTRISLSLRPLEGWQIVRKRWAASKSFSHEEKPSGLSLPSRIVPPVRQGSPQVARPSGASPMTNNSAYQGVSHAEWPKNNDDKRDTNVPAPEPRRRKRDWCHHSLTPPSYRTTLSSPFMYSIFRRQSELAHCGHWAQPSASAVPLDCAFSSPSPQHHSKRAFRRRPASTS